MRAPVCAALLVWVLSDAAARQFSEEEMAAVRYEHQLLWTRFKVEFCADTTHPPFITPAGASLRVGACV